MHGFVTVADWRDEAGLKAVPAAPGVLRVDFADAPPYVGKTVDLRRRLTRLLAPRQGASARLNLRDAADTVHYRRTGSRFESDLVFYRTVKRCRPEGGRDFLRLRAPAFVKILLGNRFPRTCVTQRLARSRALFYGPFPTRNAAEQFHEAVLDLFLVRRCVEKLEPSTAHPGCIWGEMRMCLRPCQDACDAESYGREVDRLAVFLSTDGASLLADAVRARDRASASMDFEAAARHHRTAAKAREALRLRGGLSREIGSLCGMVLQRSAEPRSLVLTPVYKGSLQAETRLGWDGEPRTAGIMAAVRAELAGREWAEPRPEEKGEHLALLQRWHGSSFRKGEFVPFESFEEAPLRKLANAAARVAAG